MSEHFLSLSEHPSAHLADELYDQYDKLEKMSALGGKTYVDKAQILDMQTGLYKYLYDRGDIDSQWSGVMWQVTQARCGCDGEMRNAEINRTVSGRYTGKGISLFSGSAKHEHGDRSRHHARPEGGNKSRRGEQCYRNWNRRRYCVLWSTMWWS